MHDVVVVGVPLIAILFGILFSRNDVKELRADMQAQFNKMDGRFNKIEDHLGRIDADLRQFYHLTGKLEARMDGLEKRN
jgi:DNA anti-recombination protein RmuC